MDQNQAEGFLAQHHQGVLITLRGDGRPQSSNIVFDFAAGAVRISTSADRAKARNLLRDPRATVHVSSADFWQYLVVDGEAEVSDVTTEPGDPVGRELAAINESIAGQPHPDWDEFYRAMVDERRVVITIRPDSFYGQVR
jgi:PPOX class probable F420-dependent enzyme